MLNLRKVAVSAAAVSATVLGTMAGLGGVAHAAPTPNSQPVTGCSVGAQSLLVAGVFPTCSSGTATVIDPTSLTVSVDPSFLNELTRLTLARGLLGTGGLLEGLLGAPAYNGLVGETVTYKVACVVNGVTTVSPTQTFNATAGTDTQVVDLQTLVGSPEPNSCEVRKLTATSTLDLGTSLITLLNGPLGALGLRDLTTALAGPTLGATVTASTAVPGAIYQKAGNAKNGYICMDDAANGNAGSAIQVFRFNSDLAQFWTYTGGGQLVRNGDCADVANGKVVLATCDGDTSQQWTLNGTGGAFGTIVNAASNDCLTAAARADMSQLTVASCNSGADQQWTGPAQTAAVVTAS